MRIAACLLIAVGCTLAGCRDDAPATKQTPSPRIVSYSPAITDMLYDMGLGAHVVGVTNYCRPPASFSPAVVGDRSRVSAEAIMAVEPDVIIIQQNPDDFGAVRRHRPNLRIEHLRIETLGDIASSVERIGRIVSRPGLGQQHRQAFERKLDAIRVRVAGRARPKVLFVGGFDRPFTGGKETFIDEMIRVAGGTNAAAERGYEGWKTLNRENILAMAPEVLVCQVDEAQRPGARAYWQSMGDLSAVRDGRVFIVTDSRWTIPSLRSAAFAAKLCDMIHPPAADSEGADD